MNKNLFLGTGLLIAIVIGGYVVTKSGVYRITEETSLGDEAGTNIPGLEEPNLEESATSSDSFSSGQENLPEPEPTPIPIPVSSPPPPSSLSPPQPQSQVKEFTIIAKQFSFEPSTITVNRGDTVRLFVKSTDVTHGIAISEFGVNEVLPPGQEKVIEFVASKSGTFPMFCSVFCGSGHLDMKGTFVVK